MTWNSYKKVDQQFKHLVLCLCVTRYLNYNFSESVNEVKLMGMIGTDIHDENATIFHIVTNSNLA